MKRSRLALVAFLGTLVALSALGFPPPSAGTAADGPAQEDPSGGAIGQYDIYGYEEYTYEDYVRPPRAEDDVPIEAPDVAGEPGDAEVAAYGAAEDLLRQGCDLCNRDGAAASHRYGLNHPCAAIDGDATAEAGSARPKAEVDMVELAANYWHSIGIEEALEINLENEGLVQAASAADVEGSLVDVGSGADASYPECEYCECCEAPRADDVAPEETPDDADYRQYERLGCGWIDCGEMPYGQAATESGAYGEQAGGGESEDADGSTSQRTGAAAAIEGAMDALRRIGRGVIEFAQPRAVRAELPRVSPAQGSSDGTEYDGETAAWPADGDQGW